MRQEGCGLGWMPAGGRGRSGERRVLSSSSRGLDQGTAHPNPWAVGRGAVGTEWCPLGPAALGRELGSLYFLISKVGLCCPVGGLRG